MVLIFVNPRFRQVLDLWSEMVAFKLPDIMPESVIFEKILSHHNSKD